MPKRKTGRWTCIMIRVVNKHTHKPTPNDYYAGRGSVLGNIFTSKPLEATKAQFQCSSREESVAKFEEYLKDKIVQKRVGICKALNDIYLLAKKGDVNLVCFCAPKLCHLNVIKDIVNEKLPPF